MKLFAINQAQKPNICFKTTCRIYTPRTNTDFKSFAQITIRNSTNLFREDLNWSVIAKYIFSHFKNFSTVNSYILASSDGSEPISYAISLYEVIKQNKNFLENYTKYMNICASDIDNEILKFANSGKINVLPIDFVSAEKNGINLSTYLKNKSVAQTIKGDYFSETDYISSYNIVPDIKNAINYKCSDMLTELKKIKDIGNSIVMCRNVFPYLSYDYQKKVIECASENLKSGSLLIIGNYDKEVRSIDKILLANGFFKPLCNEPNVFEKK